MRPAEHVVAWFDAAFDIHKQVGRRKLVLQPLMVCLGVAGIIAAAVWQPLASSGAGRLAFLRQQNCAKYSAGHNSRPRDNGGSAYLRGGSVSFPNRLLRSAR